MTVKELIERLQKMPQDKRVYVWYESGDTDVEPVYDGQEVCLWSDTGEFANAIQNDEKMRLYYRIRLYDDNTILPMLFNSWEEADDYISMKKLHAYITIM